MTDQERKAAEMALEALEFNLPVIEDFGSKEQLTDCHRAIMALYKTLTQPEQTVANKSDCGHKTYEPLCQMRRSTKQPEQFQLVCKKCGADRTKDDCKGERIKCGIMGEAQSAQPEQKPVAWEKSYDIACSLLRQAHDILATTQYPIKRPWVSLTFEEIKNIWVANYHDTDATDAFAYAIEAALRSKNT